MCCFRRSPIDTLETTFRLAASDPQTLALDGRVLGLRARRVRLLDLRPMLFHPATNIRVQRAVLVELVQRARRHRGAWLVGLTGVLLPGLPPPTEHLVTHAGDPADLEASLVDLLEELDAPEVPSEAVAERLLWSVVRRPLAGPIAEPRAPLVMVLGGCSVSRYLTVEEVAETLRVSVSWVYKHKELLGGVRLGDRLWRFPQQELTARMSQAIATTTLRADVGHDPTRTRPTPAPRKWRLS